MARNSPSVSRPRRETAVLAAAIALLVIGAVGLLAPAAVDPTDDELIDTARRAPEAVAFLGRYPSAAVTEDRSGRVAVDFRSQAARLRVFVERGPRAAGALLDCPGRAPIETNVLEAARAGCS